MALRRSRLPCPPVMPLDVGIDPSAGMLAKFALKHPDYQADATLLRTTFEDYETPLRFDTIVAMAGSRSHVTRVDVVEKARHLLAPGEQGLRGSCLRRNDGVSPPRVHCPRTLDSRRCGNDASMHRCSGTPGGLAISAGGVPVDIVR